MRGIRFSYIALGLLLPVAAAAQIPSLAGNRNFRSYSIEEGLPQSNVYCIIQDKRGYIWAGTDGGGIARFDGRKFKVYGLKNGLAGLVVRRIFEDSKGRIWIGTDQGISVYDGYTFINITSAWGLKGSTVLSFAEDTHGTMWAGTDDGGLNRIHSFSRDTAIIDVYSDTAGGLSSNTIFGLLAEKGGNLWAATISGGVMILSPESSYEPGKRQSLKIETLRGGVNIPSDLILNITRDSAGSLWFATYDAGIFMMKPNGDNYDVITFRESIPPITVWAIATVKGGNVWIGSGGNGLIKGFPGEEGYRFVSWTEEQGLPNNQVLSLLEDREGNIWAGTNGDGLVKYMGDVFSHFSEDDGLLNNTVQGIDQDSTGRLWIVTDGGGLAAMEVAGGRFTFRNITAADGLAGDFITSVDAGSARNPHIWVGTTNKGISRFDFKNIDVFTEQDGLISDRVNSILTDRNGIIWIGTAGGISRYDGVKFLNVSTEKMVMSDDGVKTVMEDREGNIWFGTAGGLARYGGDGSLTTFDEVEGLAAKDVNAIVEDKEGNIWIGTNGGGIYKFDTRTGDSIPIRFVIDDSLLLSGTINSMVFLNDGQLVATSDKGFDRIGFQPDGSMSVRSYRLSDGFTGVECSDNAVYKDGSGVVWIGTVKGLTRYDPRAEKKQSSPPEVHITELRLFFKNVDWKKEAGLVSPWFEMPAKLQLPYAKNHLTFYFSGISMDNPEKVVYSYLLEGRDEAFSPPTAEEKITYSGIEPGNYVFKVKAMNAGGVWSEPASFGFRINPPWYRTTAFYITVILLLIVGTWIYIRARERKLKEEKRILEEKVRERTAEVVKQKEEIEEQKDIIEEKNKDIMDSINYAKRIQRAMLPKEEERAELIPDSFVLFKPKDVVSGDFYWMTRHGGKILFIAADCTGHGVPGAFMSMIGSSLLNEVVNEKGYLEPSLILNEVRAGIIKSLKQTGEAGESKDGMDATLCVFDPETNRLNISAANNPLYLVRNGELVLSEGNGKQPIEPDAQANGLSLYQIDADSQPVGYYTAEVRSFTEKVFEVKNGDVLYLFSDGYADQFGGPKGKKFKYKSFKELLLSLSTMPMAEQHDALDKAIEDWKAHRDKATNSEAFEQMDDILVIGVRFSLGN